LLFPRNGDEISGKETEGGGFGRVFWDKEIELLPREDLEALQLARLRKTLQAAARAPFYKQAFAENGIAPEKVKSLEDLRRLPFTTKQDLRAGFPDGFLAVDKSEVVRMHASSGTTGTATVVYHTRTDIDRWTDLVARCLYMAGVRQTDVFQNMMSYGLFTGGLGLHYGAEKIGVMVIPMGIGNSKRQIAFMQQFGTTVAHIIPSYSLKLLETFDEMGIDPKNDTSLRILVVGAEPHSEEVRARIEEAYGVFAVNSYGLSEMNGPGVAFECPHKSGIHLWEDSYILEVVDPQTLEPMPEGETGEIVLTTLRREAMPLIRYRTRDLAMALPGTCSCGRAHRRLSRIKGRSDDMVIVKGVNVYPIQVEQVLMGLEEVGNNYLILLDRDGPVDRMTVRIEVTSALLAKGLEGLEALRAKISRHLRDEILVTPKVELVEPGTIPAAEGKALRVIDNRPKE
jgi:phenylacetate-CoA ligase